MGKSLSALDLGGLDTEQPEDMCTIMAHLGKVVPRASTNYGLGTTTGLPRRAELARRCSNPCMAASYPPNEWPGPFIRLCGAKLHANSDKSREGTGGCIRKRRPRPQG